MCMLVKSRELYLTFWSITCLGQIIWEQAFCITDRIELCAFCQIEHFNTFYQCQLLQNCNIRKFQYLDTSMYCEASFSIWSFNWWNKKLKTKCSHVLKEWSFITRGVGDQAFVWGGEVFFCLERGCWSFLPLECMNHVIHGSYIVRVEVCFVLRVMLSFVSHTFRDVKVFSLNPNRKSWTHQ